MFKHLESVDVFVYMVYMALRLVTDLESVGLFVNMVYKALRLVTGPCSNIWRVLMYLSLWSIWLLD